MKNSPTLEPEGLSISQACAIAGIGRSKLYQVIQDRRLVARKIGARTIILRSDLQEFLASLPTA
jgi:excisionase family DNA binding protein